MAARKRTCVKDGLKTCKRCGVAKPNTRKYFSGNIRYVDGLQYTCRECNKKECREYRERQTPLERYEKHPARRRQARDRCYYCKRGTLHAGGLCLKHWLKVKSGHALGTNKLWKELVELAHEQDWKCALTGEDLIPGVNMSIDHKYAKSTHPELEREFSNIQWTTVTSNFAKRDMSVEQFVEMCVKVAVHAGQAVRINQSDDEEDE